MTDLIDPRQMTTAFETRQDRRQFLGNAAIGIASAGAASLLSVHPVLAAKGEDISPISRQHSQGRA
ncbi:hypothetical protein ACVWY2_000615 [Bradyrhizobium sp. JR6.1]